MNDGVIENVVDLLKGINNSAVGLIQKGDFEAAVKMFELGEETSLRFNYIDGALSNRLNMIKVQLLSGNFLQVIDSLDIMAEFDVSDEMRKEVTRFFKEASVTMLKAGMDMEANGDMRNALRMFERIHPYLNNKRADLVGKEIEMLRSKLGTDENPTDREDIQ